MSHYTTHHKETIDGFDIVFSTTYEDTHPCDHFMPEDAPQICEDIDNGKYEWFVARVQAFKNGIELGTEYLGGCLYESPMQFVKEDNDYYSDMVQSAIKEAKANIKALTVLLKINTSYKLTINQATPLSKEHHNVTIRIH